MNYEVIWDPTAEQELAAAWLSAIDRNALTAAAAWLDERLAESPLALGRPRSSSVHRTAYRSPLGIEFEVIEDDKRVIVRAVFAVG
jgi:plasmid stabilization system protein ParE